VRAVAEGGGCFPTGRHYPGIAHLLRISAAGIADEFEAAMAIVDVPLCAIDTETTGRDPAVDRIVEIACVTWHRGQVVSSKRWLINPGRPIPQEARDVHGIGDDDVARSPPFAEVVEELLAELTDKVPVAYNAEFDRAFLNDEVSRAGLRRQELPPALRQGVEWLDPLVWARELQKDEKSKALGEVASRLGIDLARAHRATDDAEAAMRVLDAFFVDARVPAAYGAFVQEQRRLARLHAEDRVFWRGRGPATPGG
jgi:DNA polymerase-3 subunit epsilon